MTTTLRWILASATAIGALAPTAHATCAYVGLGPHVMTTRTTALPADGGVLVGYQAGGNAGDAEPADPSSATGWTASDGAHAVALTRTSLAPGLSLFKLAGDKPTTIKTKDDKPVGAFTHDAAAAANTMPAPAPTAAKTTSVPSFRSRTTTSQVTLAKPPPPEAVALIVYQNATPITYGRLPDTHDKLTSVVVFEGGGHCALPTVGTALSTDTYTFAYVDAFGRLSPQSKPLKAR